MLFIEYLELKQYSPSTIKNYSRYHTQLKPHIYTGITQESINQFVRMHNHHVVRAFLKTYKEYLKNEGTPNDFEIPNISGRKAKKAPQWFSIREIRYLVLRAPMPYSLLISLLFESGLRITEALSVTRADVLGYESNNGLIISLKGRTRRVRVTVKTLNALCHYSVKHELSQKIFPFDRFHAYYKLKKIIQQLFPGKKRIYTHMFRVSSATHLLNTGMNIRNIQKYLGHSSITATAKYTQVTDADVEKQWVESMEVE